VPQTMVADEPAHPADIEPHCPLAKSPRGSLITHSLQE